MSFRVVAVAVLAPCAVLGQVTSEDYERALGAPARYERLVVNSPGPVSWLAGTTRFWYRRSLPGGSEFIVIDAETLGKKPAFDHQRLAAALSQAASEKYTATTLPFTTIAFSDAEQSIQFSLKGSEWKCDLGKYSCSKAGDSRPNPEALRDARPPEDAEYDNDVFNGTVHLSPQQSDNRSSAGSDTPTVRASPDGRWDALIRNHNVFIRQRGTTEASPLSHDGSEGSYYTLQSIAWSPDSKCIAAYRVRPGYRRQVHYIESSPADQLQPKHSSRIYAKPGDTLDIASPVLFDVAANTQRNIDNALFPNPYSLTAPVWRKDGRGFTFEYNQRGHQLYRIIEVNASTADARAVISEESRTFIDYRPLVPNQRDTGKKLRYDVDDGREIIWMSERDGWSHLYLYDGFTGRLKNQITKGSWVVRATDKIDEVSRQIWFQASGMYPGKDPYFVHNYRINFDGTGLTALTDTDANHSVVYSPDMRYYVDTWSRVDLPPVVQLRRTEDRKVLMDVERAGIELLKAAGWNAPEVFTAKGRDGKTDIWGVLYWPPNLDRSKKYPVVEAIYAGPQGSFVPKAFATSRPVLSELGFIVAQIDGMGTNNRSKPFHDVAWRNLRDAGLQDRILWHKAVAEKYPWYDISRVGIFGNSAGGQNAMAALLFHPEFYKVGVSSSGCHDNRMDKIWWNEQWMGWPVGPHYTESSNVENAWRLQGKQLLIVPEMDTNVDPSSTLQVVNALIRANKKFDLLYVPGANHGAGGVYGQRLMFDFFIHHLFGIEPPEWRPEKHQVVP